MSASILPPGSGLGTSTGGEANEAITSIPVDSSKENSNAPSPIPIAVYISGHGYGHYTRTLNFLSLFPPTQYTFHIRTTCLLASNPLPYPLQPIITQTSAYNLDTSKSLHSLSTFSSLPAEEAETLFLESTKIRAIISDAVPLASHLGHRLNIPSILITNFTFDNIFQALLSNASPEINKEPLQKKIEEMTTQYNHAHTVLRLPGYIPFHFTTPNLVSVPMHFRPAKKTRLETLTELNLSHLHSKKILLECFGGHASASLSTIPSLPENWVCISQSISSPPTFYKIDTHVYMPDLISACDVVLGKLGWGTCSEVIGNGRKPFVYVPREEFVEEEGLRPWMEGSHGRMVRLSVEAYEGCEWSAAVEEAWGMRERERDGGVEENWKENERELVRVFGETIESALR